MGFVYSIDEEQHKLRINLSERAFCIMLNDMQTFSFKSRSGFINTVFSNYYEDAKSSISLYLKKKKETLENLLSSSTLSDDNRAVAVKYLVDNEMAILKESASNISKEKGKSLLYYINKANFEILTADDFKENIYYDERLSVYIKCLLEEYFSLSFIERLKIVKKKIYNTINIAIKAGVSLEIDLKTDNEEKSFIVYPYKIVTNVLHTYDYLTCYSYEKQKNPASKTISSFSLVRLQESDIKLLHNLSFNLNKNEILALENKMSKVSATYLLGEETKVVVKLSEKGERLLKTILNSKPVKTEKVGEGLYHFFCSEEQAYNYFFSFSAEAEILSPPALREKLKHSYQSGLKNYL